jgi:hypothetical protein
MAGPKEQGSGPGHDRRPSQPPAASAFGPRVSDGGADSRWQGGGEGPFQRDGSGERRGGLPGAGLSAPAAARAGAQAQVGGHPLIGAARLGLGTFGGAWNPTTALRDGAVGLGGPRRPWSGAGQTAGDAGRRVAGTLAELGRGLHGATGGAGTLLSSGAVAAGPAAGERAVGDAAALAGTGGTLHNGAPAVGAGPSNLAADAAGDLARPFHKLFG